MSERTKQLLTGVELFSELDDVELLTGYEGNAFFTSGRAEEDLLATTSVHPMRADAVDGLLRSSGEDWSLVQRLLGEGELIEVRYGGWSFFVRKLKPARRNANS